MQPRLFFGLCKNGVYLFFHHFFSSFQRHARGRKLPTKGPEAISKIKSFFFCETSGRDDATPGFPDVDQVVVIGGDPSGF